MGNNLTYHSVGNDSSCQGVTNDAGIYVEWYQNGGYKIALDAIKKLDEAIASLTDIDWSAEGFSASAGALQDFGILYNTPDGVPEWDFTLAMPNFDVPNPILDPVDPIIHSVFDAEKPVNSIEIREPDIPEPLSATIPDTAPVIKDVVIPDVPEMGYIADPILRPIDIPSLTPITIPDFDGVLPSKDLLRDPDNEFTYVEAPEYDSIILRTVQSRIEEFLAGGVGIPDYVWDMIWDRGREKENRNGLKLVNEITEEYASKGFDLPQGSQTARIDQAHKEVHDAVNTYNRELVIQQAQHEIENLKYAVAQGMALENILGGWYQQRQDRALAAAQFASQAGIELFNARVALFNAHMSYYQAQLAAYKIELEAELTKLEIYKTELEAAKIIGELNMQELEIYKTRIQTYAIEIEAYNSLIKALGLGIEIDKTRMDAYKAEVQAFSELVQAKTSEWVGYKAQWDGENSKVAVFESEVKAYASQAGAYKVEVDAEIAEKDVRLRINDQAFKTFSSGLERHNANVKSELANLEGESKAFDASARGYGLDVDNEKNRTLVKLDEKKASIQYAGQATQAAIVTAQNLTAAATAEKDSLKTSTEIMARAYSQLAASALSVINVSAGISDRSGNSASCSQTTSK